MMRLKKSAGVLFLPVMLAFGCSSHRPPDPRYQPSRNLLEVVGEFQRFFREDSYRFPAPKDLSGVNIYKATLARLDDYEKKYPGRSSEIVYFTKAQALERLWDYEKARSYYEKVVEGGTRLKEKAQTNVAVLKELLDVRSRPTVTTNYIEYIRSMDEKVSLWSEFIKRHAGTPYEYLAREEEERLDRAKVVFVEINRFHLQDGNQLVISGFQQLLAKHQASKNFNRYLLELADFYSRLAHETVLQTDPQALDFPMEGFTRTVSEGLKLYSEVAGKDGVEEKPEASAKLSALAAFQKRVRDLNQ